MFAARRGVDLDDFSLLPFGGAGAVHAAAVAEELGMRRIIVPLRPGAFSALGLLCTDVLHDYVRSELRPLAELDPAHAEQMFRAIEARAARELADEGLDPAQASFEREFDLRYAGQGYELRVPLAGHFSRRPSTRSTRGARRRARALRRAARAHPRPCRGGKAGRAGQLSPARARRRAEIPRTSRRRSAPPRRRRDAAIKAPASFISTRAPGRRRKSWSATGCRSAQPSPALPSSSSSTPRPSCRPAGARASIASAISF